MSLVLVMAGCAKNEEPVEEVQTQEEVTEEVTEEMAEEDFNIVSNSLKEAITFTNFT